MIDVELLRTSPDIFRDSIKKRFGDVKLIDEYFEVDKDWKKCLAELEALRHERNQKSNTRISDSERKKMAKVKEKIQVLEKNVAKLELKRQKKLALIPNFVNKKVPIGEGTSANQTIKEIGKKRLTQGLPHEELMTNLNWLDLETASKFSGSRFRYLKNHAALAHLNLMTMAFKFAIKKGFIPVIPPILAHSLLFENAGFFPIGKDDTYPGGDDLFITGTSEPMMVALASKKIFATSDLPLRMVGFSTCLRQEAGSYGQDVKGMFRQHQFDKVEMVSITAPEDSDAELENLFNFQKEFVNQFDIPYQLVEIGSGDLSNKEARKLDIEAWFPSQQRYRETHSTSNCTDYQTRGFDIKVKIGDQLTYAHALNGTLATERLLLAIVENYQQSDGRVKLPKSLLI